MRDNGKTTFLRRYIETGEPRVLGLDLFNDFEGLQEAEVDDALDDLARGGPCRRRIRVPIGSDIKGMANYIFRSILDEEIRNFLFLGDEITKLVSKRGDDEFTTLLLQGRHLGVRFATACQRIAKVPDDILSEVTDLVLFKTVRPRDLITVGDWVGKNAASQCRQLAQGQCLMATL